MTTGYKLSAMSSLGGRDDGEPSDLHTNAQSGTVQGASSQMAELLTSHEALPLDESSTSASGLYLDFYCNRFSVEIYCCFEVTSIAFCCDYIYVS